MGSYCSNRFYWFGEGTNSAISMGFSENSLIKVTGSSTQSNEYEAGHADLFDNQDFGVNSSYVPTKLYINVHSKNAWEMSVVYLMNKHNHKIYKTTNTGIEWINHETKSFSLKPVHNGSSVSRPCEKFKFIIHTSVADGASTNGTVYAKLIDKAGFASDTMKLGHITDDFQAGSTFTLLNGFHVESCPLSDIHSVILFKTNNGGWLPDDITTEPYATDILTDVKKTIGENSTWLDNNNNLVNLVEVKMHTL